MEWIIIPLITLPFLGFAIWWGIHNNWEGGQFALLIVTATIVIVAWVAFPSGYVSTYNHSLEAEAYYQNVLMPNKVSETSDYITVTGLEGGVWQAGTLNLPKYNSYLVKTRFWDKVPIVGWGIYSPPDYLKQTKVISISLEP